MNKLLVICGPTATGKTHLALYLAKKFNGELISADSRQVYKYMNVITGKDIPDKAVWLSSAIQFNGSNVGYWETDNIRIWGYDLVDPSYNFNVSSFMEVTEKIIENIISRNKLPILVGGTGFYISGVVDGIQTARVPVNNELRDQLTDTSAADLYRMLLLINPRKAMSLNSSDQKNPRRLIRAIEVTKHLGELENRKPQPKYDAFWIGLTMSDRQNLNNRIDQRVMMRISPELDAEMALLAQEGYINQAPARTIGYKEWLLALNNTVTRQVAATMWKRAEHVYAKRQMTWFRKQKHIAWYDIEDKKYYHKVEENVKKWHNQEYTCEN
ncbi:tRNA dimethylallyltransferase [Candidatus Woesebacteria bacterium]|nr:MAG: tRNA dimethylallyltransferase [Candidatus Woesebacteria bacterium]